MRLRNSREGRDVAGKSYGKGSQSLDRNQKGGGEALMATGQEDLNE